MLDGGWVLRVDDMTNSHLTAIAVYDTQQAATVTVEHMPLGEWVHVAAVFTGGEWYIAINGVWCTYSQQNPAIGSMVTDDTIDCLHGACHVDGDPASFLEGRLQWVRYSDDWRFLPGLDFTPPVMCAPPAVDAATVEIWAMDEGAGLATVASINSPANDGAGTAITWGVCS